MTPDGNGFDDQIVDVEIDVSTFVPRPATGASLRKAEEYLEKLRQYYPEEYERIMNERNARKQQGQ